MFAKINPNFLIVGAVLLVGFAILSISRQASAPRETINMEQMAVPPEEPGIRADRLPEQKSGKQP